MDCLCSTGKEILKGAPVIQKTLPTVQQTAVLFAYLYSVHVSNQCLYKTFCSKSNWKMGLLSSRVDNSSINKGSQDKGDMQSQP